MLPDSLKKLFRRNEGSLNHSVIGVGLLALCVAITIVSVTYDNKAALIQKDLEKEFAQVQHLPGAVPVEPIPTSIHKWQRALVSNKFKTKNTYPEIRTHYDSELAKHGWKYQKEKDITVWGRYSGGKHAYYSKGPYTASLQYAGQSEQEEMGWTYSFDIGWGF